MKEKHPLGWLPNAISVTRMLCVPALILFALVGAQGVFSVLLFLALASDLVDGWLARRWSVVSKQGALLDSVADIALTLTILIGVWILHPEVYQLDGWVIYSLLLAWLLAHSASLLRYGRLASFHTWLIRIGIATFNLFALVLFTYEYYPWLLYLSATLSFFGVLEHFALLALLREWSPDIPGGLLEVLRQDGLHTKTNKLTKSSCDMSLYGQMKATLVKLLRVIPAFDWRYAQYELGALYRVEQGPPGKIEAVAEPDEAAAGDQAQVPVEVQAPAQAQEPASLAGHTYPAGHYYSPVPERRVALQHIASRPPATEKLANIELNTSAQLDLLQRFQPFYAALPFTHEKSAACRYWYLQDWFGQSDSIFLYSMLRLFKPQRIIEVGSGFSSAVMLDTRERFLDPKTSMTFIEPYTERLRELLRPADFEQCTLIEDMVQGVALSIFEELEANDLLFIDSSHVLKCGSDLQHLMFDVLPVLKPGVIVHFHDIFYPFEYPQEWVAEGRYWNECYLLHAFLSSNKDWEILLFGNYVAQFHHTSIKEWLPLCLENGGGSLYLRRKAS